MQIGHQLPRPELKVVPLTLGQHRAQLRIGERQEDASGFHVSLYRKPFLEDVRDLQEPGKKDLLLRPPANRQEIDNLEKQLRSSAARAADGGNQFREAGKKSIVAGAQQRPARHVADAGRLDDDRPRLAAGEALVPGEHFGRDEALFRGTPGHHRRHPGALGEAQRPDLERLKPARRGCGSRRRPGRLRQRVPDALRRLPHPGSLPTHREMGTKKGHDLSCPPLSPSLRRARVHPGPLPPGAPVRISRGCACARR